MSGTDSPGSGAMLVLVLVLAVGMLMVMVVPVGVDGMEGLVIEWGATTILGQQHRIVASIASPKKSISGPS